MKLEIHGLWPTLFLVFLIIKLTGVINWPWWAVCLPLAIPFIFVFCIMLIAIVLLIISNLTE